MSRRPRILVVGSINMDLLYRTARLPQPGETRSGHSFCQLPGGKGANQAVAAARLGASVAMIGRVGDDSFGQSLIAGLSREGIDVYHVQVIQNCSSGLAMIGVEDSGQNSIVVIPGANAGVLPEDVMNAETLFESADVVLLQFEIPLPAIQTAIALAHKHHVKVILDPAPAMENVPPEVLAVDAVCPNESEAASLSGLRIDCLSTAIEAAQAIQRRGPKLSLITLGSEGSVLTDGGSSVHIPPFSVNAIDTTAAGDAFAAALGVALAEGLSAAAAARFASAAGALATTRRGGQSAMPGREEVETLLINVGPE